MNARLRVLALCAAAALLAILAAADVASGAASLPLRDVWNALFDAASVADGTRVIVRTFRLPAALLAVAVGLVLGVSGAVMQTTLDNPLASPYTLGVSAAAGFGAGVGILLSSQTTSVSSEACVSLGAFAFALLATLAVYAVAKLKRASRETTVLAGILALFLFNAGTAFLKYASDDEQLQSLVFWLFGSLQGATTAKAALVFSVAGILLAWTWARSWRLTALRLGEEHAEALGVRTERLRLEMLLLVSVATATVVATVGTIGFIGLAAPHLARFVVGEDHRFYLPASALFGAALLSAASVLSKVLVPGSVFPIGIASAFIGIPFFAAVLFCRKGGR